MGKKDAIKSFATGAQFLIVGFFASRWSESQRGETVGARSGPSPPPPLVSESEGSAIPPLSAPTGLLAMAAGKRKEDIEVRRIGHTAVYSRCMQPICKRKEGRGGVYLRGTRNSGG